jgi:hypothetical protein
MFCPKCGIKNPGNGVFCRSCGTDLKVVSDAISGKYSGIQRGELQVYKEDPKILEGAMSSLFSGFAFLAIAIFLGITGITGGRYWWFWLLIPAFGAIGYGMAALIRLRQANRRNSSIEMAEKRTELSGARQKSLPEGVTEFVSDFEDLEHKTGDLAPSSVVENTTRHLEMETEPKSMTPKDK